MSLALQVVQVETIHDLENHDNFLEQKSPLSNRRTAFVLCQTVFSSEAKKIP